MTWLAPGMAWFALLIPAVLLLWFLRMRRRDVEVSSTLLWSKVLEDKRVNSPFQRLRRSILLLLQILAIALLTAALAQPERQGERLAGRVHLLLVDISASMAVDEGGGTRFGRARAQARERIDRMGEGERAVVITFDQGARAITPVTDDRALLARALDRLEPGSAATRIGPAMELALAIAERETDAVAVIISDGDFEPWEGKQIPLPLEYVPVGEGVRNAGITALSARPEIGAEGALRVFVEVRNPGPDRAAGTLTLSLGGQTVRAADHEGIEPAGRWPHTFEVSGGGAGEVLEVVWEPRGEDLLAADDRAWIIVEPPPTLRVWQIGPPNFALDDAISVLPRTEVEILTADAAKERLASAGAALPDVIIWDRTAPAALPAGPAHLFLGALPPGVWVPEPALAKEPPVISWDREHPLHRFVGYAGLDGEIAEGWLLPDLPHSRALLDSRGGALIRTFRHEGSEGIVVAFDAMKTRWPLRPSFPFFLQAALAHLGRRGDAVEGIRPGDLIAIEGGPEVERFRLTEPSGRTRELAPAADGWLRFAETDQLGLYRIEWTEPGGRDAAGQRRAPVERERIVPVSLLSLRESSIAPQPKIAIAGAELTAESANRALVNEVYWPWLTALACALLLGEWYFYHRR
jgi:hypothetical protein